TRTRVSFEVAARRLSADVISLTASTTSLKKGESLIDTALTLSQYGVDIMVVRHPGAGAPDQIAEPDLFGVVNAGDGMRAHPTQALLDAYTVYRELGRVKGLNIAFIGDILHSRVARSSFELFGMLGARLYAVAPSAMLPDYLPAGVKVLADVDEAIKTCDVLYFLRIQN
ncbi:aspartate carbamoyltransferase, partial [Candidatus Bipolaricaulota bacterium]|nr:aspartate carbamoyltransferase [Candidatus Bipolaricaulota bacterium]